MDLDIPRTFNIRERDHRIHNPFTAGDLAALAEATGIGATTTILDLGCGSGELLCTWARDHGAGGTGVDLSSVFIAAARARAEELGVTDRVRLVHADAAGHVAEEPVDVAACLGATWIGGGVDGTVELLARSLRPGGMVLVGEPYWRREPADEQTVRECHAQTREDFKALPDLLDHLGGLGYDVVQMVLGSQEGWDRYMAAQWLTMRRWCDENPQDELVGELRAALAAEPAVYARSLREHVGWGVFALIAR